MLRKILPLFIVAFCWGLIILGTAAVLRIKNNTTNRPTAKSGSVAQPTYQIIATIPPPPGYQKMQYARGSFGFFLQHLPLKKDKTVYLFNGTKKQNQTAQFAVLDISTGKENLQQCADAVMRLWAEYWWGRGDATMISFADNDGKKYKLPNGASRQQFNIYLSKVFGMCGSYSLAKQLSTVAIKDMQCGDVLIRGGFPGHAVLVVDMAEHRLTHQRMYLLAQGYMPAQDIHVLNNPMRPGSPWYLLNDTASDIYTPQFRFKKWELKRF